MLPSLFITLAPLLGLPSSSSPFSPEEIFGPQETLDPLLGAPIVLFDFPLVKLAKLVGDSRRGRVERRLAVVADCQRRFSEFAFQVALRFFGETLVPVGDGAGEGAPGRWAVRKELDSQPERHQGWLEAEELKLEQQGIEIFDEREAWTRLVASRGGENPSCSALGSSDWKAHSSKLEALFRKRVYSPVGNPPPLPSTALAVLRPVEGLEPGCCVSSAEEGGGESVSFRFSGQTVVRPLATLSLPSKALVQTLKQRMPGFSAASRALSEGRRLSQQPRFAAGEEVLCAVAFPEEVPSAAGSSSTTGVAFSRLKKAAFRLPRAALATVVDACDGGESLKARLHGSRFQTPLQEVRLEKAARELLLRRPALLERTRLFTVEEMARELKVHSAVAWLLLSSFTLKAEREYLVGRWTWPFFSFPKTHRCWFSP